MSSFSRIASIAVVAAAPLAAQRGEPGSGDVRPGGVAPPAQRGPFAAAMDGARLEHVDITYGPGDEVHVQLPAGAYEGIAIQEAGSWAPIDVVAPWWGDATLVVHGHPDGTTILPAHDEPGWGASLSVRPVAGWEARVWFVGLDIHASGGNAVDIGIWGKEEKLPLLDVRFLGCSFLDHPSEEIECIRPVSANQATIFFYACTWDLPNSIEHAVYNRNPVGDCGMLECHVKAVGGQVWQEVNRPEEGPYYGRGRTVLANSLFENYHQNPANAGSALTFAGSGRDVVVESCVVLDIEAPAGDSSHGGFVSWDGGTYYTLEGKPIWPGDSPQPGEYANGTLRVEDNLFVQKDPNRSILQIDSCEYAVVRGNGFYGERPVEILSHVDDADQLEDAGMGGAIWEDNNGPLVYQTALLLGIPEELLIEPKLLVKGEEVGPASVTFEL